MTPVRIFNQRALNAARVAARQNMDVAKDDTIRGRMADLLADTIIAAYQTVLVNEQFTNNRVARSTRELAMMEVGDSRPFAAAARSCLYNNMKTARRLIGNPQARWELAELPSGLIKATRLMDGASPRRDPKNNLRAVQIAAIPVGSAALCKAFRDVHSLARNTKIAARRLLDDDQADWRARTTNHGVKIMRFQ